MMTSYRSYLTTALLVCLAGCTANSGPISSTNTGSGTGTGTGTGITILLAKAAPVVTMKISPSTISIGQSATVSWSTTGATACTASGAWSGSLELSNAGQTIGPIAAAGTYSYGVNCTGPGGSNINTQTLTVGTVPAPSIQFSLTPVQIQPGNSAHLTWSTSYATSCTGSGGTGTDGWTANQPTSDLSGLAVGPITAAGNYPYDLTCTGPGGTAEQSTILTVSSTAPPAPPTLTFSAASTLVAPGQSAQLSWTTTDATACSATGGAGSDGWSGAQPVTGVGTTAGPLTTAGAYQYTLTCTGSGGSVAQNVDILVSSTPPPTPTVSIDVSPTQITAGNSAALTWATTNATTCIASGSWNGSEPLSGSAVTTGALLIPGIYSYTLQCTGAGGSAAGNATATLTVNPAVPTIVNLAASPTSITSGQTVAVSWSTRNATSCTASGGSGNDGWTGSVGISSTGQTVGPVSPANTYTYSLTCTGPGGTSAPSSVNVTVTGNQNGAAVRSFMASPSTVLVGHSTLLAWSSVNATDCTAGGNGPGWSGTQPASSTGLPLAAFTAAGVFTYTLTCNGPGGMSAPVSVLVNANNTVPAAAILAFTANPGAMQVGQSTQLAWTTTDATSCTASDGSGADAWAGSVGTTSTGTAITVNTAGNYSYALTCSGPGGASAPSSVEVNVSTAPPVPTIGTLTATPSSVQTNQLISLAWSSTGATSCAASGGTLTDGWNGATVAASSSGTPIGPLTPAGAYTYTLICTGPGGTSAPLSTTVNVTNATPPASIAALTAVPGTIWVGQSTQLAWSSSNATSCTATVGSGSDGWNGSVGVSSTGTTIGPLNTAGTFVYTLTCNGPGGFSAPSSVSVNVDTMPATPVISSFSATPRTITTGQSSTLAWSTTGASTCTASGGAAGDGWTNGTVGTSSAATSVDPTALGPVNYTLVCNGPGGQSAPSTATVTVNAVVIGQPTVALSLNGVSTAQIQPGQAPTLSWTSSNATSCTASGGTGTDGWSGSQPVSSTGATLNTISTPGVYSYTLNCTGAGGSNSSTVTLTVIASSTANCGIGVPSTLLQTPAATASWQQLTGVCVLGCGVLNLNYLLDGSGSTYATEYTTVSVGAAIELRVTDVGATFPAGRTAGFIVADNGTLLSLSALGNVSVVTFLNSQLQESASLSTLLTLQALGTLYDPQSGYVAFRTSKPFNAVSFIVDSLATAGSSFKVYGACVTLQ